MEKGEVPGLGRSEAQGGSPPWALQTSCQPQGSQHRQELCWKVSAVQPGEGEHQGCQTCSLRDVRRLSSVSMGKAEQELAGQLLPQRRSFSVPAFASTDRPQHSK